MGRWVDQPDLDMWLGGLLFYNVVSAVSEGYCLRHLRRTNQWRKAMGVLI